MAAGRFGIVPTCGRPQEDAVTTPWLIRIPEIFAGFTPQIFAEVGATPQKQLGGDYHLVRLDDPATIRDSEWRIFTSWNLPVDHAWPCHPQKMEGFIEKATQGIATRFSGRSPQALFTGPLQPGASHPFYKHLATNLRGRALQVLPPLPVPDVEGQNPTLPTLFCLVGKEGLYSGMQSPRESNGFFPGGTKFIRQDNAISRAGAKLAEALHYLLLHRPPLSKGARWLELGASPGGMTAELLDRGFHVTAIDKASLDPRLNRAPGLRFVRADVAEFDTAESFDALLCDMNGDPRASLHQVIRLSKRLGSGGLILFTLKCSGEDSAEGMLAQIRTAEATAAAAGLKAIAKTHLSYNRWEFTLFFER